MRPSLIILLALLVSCNSNQGVKYSFSDDLSISEKNRPSLNGTWGLTNYFDSIEEHKELAKYRLNAPTWFGILLQINNDSLIGYGSLIETAKKLNLESDTLTYFNSYGGKWNLIRDNEVLLLKQAPKQEVLDTVVYTYRKRSDLGFMTENLDKKHKISSNVTKYFNNSLFTGRYKVLSSDKVIEFKENGSLIGIDSFTHFNVRNYFGTLHPHKNLDVISFLNPETNKYKQYNWKFENEDLILTEFISEIILYEGEEIITDDFVLGNEIIKLIRI